MFCSWQGASVLVTGGGGFIGSSLTESLINNGAHVTVLDQVQYKYIDKINGNKDNFVSLVQDVQYIDWEKILLERSFDYIFHMAGNANVPLSVENPKCDYCLNLLITFKLLDAIRMTSWKGTLIFPSSAAVYGNPIKMPIDEDNPTYPISPYGVSKLACERYISVFSQLYGFQAASLRIFSVYGPRQMKLVVYDFVKKILNNPEEIQIYGDGNQLRDFIFVEDAVKGIMTVAEKGNKTGEVYNLASGHVCTITELAEMICESMGVNPEFKYTGLSRLGEPIKWCVDIQKIKSLGFAPSYTLKAGIEKTIEWVSKTEKIRN